MSILRNLKSYHVSENLQKIFDLIQLSGPTLRERDYLKARKNLRWEYRFI